MNDYWSDCWKNAHTPWSYQGSDDLAIKRIPEYIAERLTEGAPVTSHDLPNNSLRTFVPLCGDSPIVQFLHEHQCTVTAIDLIPSPIRELREQLFSELTFKKTTTSTHTTWKAERLSLIEGDFFACSIDQQFDLIYDRAALVAIEPQRRAQYVEKIMSLLAPHGRLFLEFFDVGEFSASHPPFPIMRQTVRQLFTPLHEVSFSEQRKKIADSPFYESPDEEFSRCWIIFEKTR